ncbi:MAG: ABC transporter ATP-binding protein [Sulfurimonas sp.]|uniref:ABC transporter ATP-binding protein n=1 Tax=Sulfurimonas sp. TaxID=2022749 RepID=UPI0025FC539F|nr:ABC transporter ATP-binding protein [Sulfurimonas sp.]MCK9492019.1 ABC transporter ATP-binding protein [Sulfurimonas sp.]
MIKITNLTKSYGEKKALDNLSLEIKKGSVFGLLGVNGAGKTTLLSILNGLISQDSGSVEIFGLDMNKELKKVKSLSSIIPQHLAFYEDLSVKENLDFFAKVQNAEKESYDKSVEINSLEEILLQKASTLSGGQKRRLNIAIGLLNNPKVIYFDEPTVGIDPKSRNEILDSIKEYKNFGITVIYTSHYMNEIEKICDEVAIIDHGKLIEQNSVENLITNRSSDSVSVEVIYSEKLQELGLDMSSETTIKTKESELFATLKLCKTHKISIKQINYGSSNLEKHFLDITGAKDV